MCLTFEAFMAEINNLLLTEVGAGYEDLPDFDYQGCYEDRFTPAETVQSLISEIAGVD